MKKQIVFLAVLFFCVVALQAEEQISSISFNPSRLGLFEQLRLTEGLTSHGNVTVENAINIRQDTGLTTKDGLDVRETIDAQKGLVNIPNTNLNVTGSMAVNGGFALFRGASTLGGLPANTWVYAPTIKSGTLTITGSNDGALLFDPDSYAQGLVLGGNDIPVPNHSECEGDLAWVTRKAADGKTYDVLAVTKCKDTTTGEEDPCKENPESCCTEAGYKWYPARGGFSGGCGKSGVKVLSDMSNYSFSYENARGYYCFCIFHPELDGQVTCSAENIQRAWDGIEIMRARNEFSADDVSFMTSNQNYSGSCFYEDYTQYNPSTYTFESYDACAKQAYEEAGGPCTANVYEHCKLWSSNYIQTEYDIQPGNGCVYGSHRDGPSDFEGHLFECDSRKLVQFTCDWK